MQERLIQKGTFGLVYRSTWEEMPAEIKNQYNHPNNMPIAIKKPSSASRAKYQLDNEIEIFRQLTHPNIVTLLCVLSHDRSNIKELVMELMDSSLSDWLLSVSDEIRFDWKESIALDIANALHHLHSYHILYRDLKCENVLVKRDSHTIIAKICDFGIAANLSSHPSFNRFVGTEEYLAPEIIISKTHNHLPYSTKSDIYAFAIVLWVLMTQRLFFKEYSTNDIFKFVRQGKRDKIPQQIPADFQTLITDCWHQNPDHRPTTTDIIKRLKRHQAFSDLDKLAKNTTELTEEKKARLSLIIKTYMSPFSLNIEVSSFLHHVFAINNAPIIHEIAILSEWDWISNSINTQTGDSLFDQIILSGHEEYYELFKPGSMSSSNLSRAFMLAIKYGREGFCKRLISDGVDLNATYHGDTPLIFAAHKGNAELCLHLLGCGADPQLKNDRHQTAEQAWPGLPERNPFSWLRYELMHLAKNTSDLSEEKKARLLHIITTHVHLLTWALDDLGHTFLKHVFDTENNSVIHELKKIPAEAMSKNEKNIQISQSLAKFGVFPEAVEMQNLALDMQALSVVKSGI